MSQKVYMTHPELPDQPIRVRPAAVAAYERARWKVTPEPAPEPVDDEQDGKPPTRRRRSAKPPATQQAGN